MNVRSLRSGSLPAVGLMVMLLMLLTAAPAQALPINTVTFDLTSPTPIQTFLGGPTLTDPGTNLSVTASALPRATNQDADGMGVSAGLFNPDPTDDPQLDGFNPAEALTFLFSERVRLQAIVFTRIGTDDNAAVYMDGHMIYFNTLPGGNAGDTGTYFMDLSASVDPNLYGTQLSFIAFTPMDDYRVQSLLVTLAPHAPLPETLGLGALLLTALAGGRALRRKGRPVISPGK